MSRKRFACICVFGLGCFLVIMTDGPAFAQWGSAPTQTPSGQQSQYPPVPHQYPQGQQQYPPVQPQYPPHQQPYPQQPQFPGQTPQQQTMQSPGPVFSDALGRFRVNLPQGTMPVGAVYNFAIPHAMCQVNINAITQDQMFQMQQQNFPNMFRQMGGKIDSEQQVDAAGRQGRLIAGTMRDQMSGMSMSALNVFISGANLWVQVMGPEQNAQQLNQILQAVLGGLQF